MQIRSLAIFGTIVQISPPLFALIVNASFKLEGISEFLIYSYLGLIVWVTIGIASFLSGELFGREVSQGATLFYAQLPVTRFDRMFCKLSVVIVVLFFWYAILVASSSILLLHYPTPNGFSYSKIPANASILTTWLSAAAFAALVSERTGNVAAALLVSFVGCGTLTVACQLSFQPNFGLPTLIIQGVVSFALFSLLWLFRFDVELDKQ